MIAGSDPAFAATFTVDEADDSLSDGACIAGACTCRDGFDAANASAGSDVLELAVDCELKIVGTDDTNAQGDLDAWDSSTGTTLTIRSNTPGTVRSIFWGTGVPAALRDRMIHTQTLGGNNAVNINLIDIKLTGGQITGAPVHGGGCIAVVGANLNVDHGEFDGCKVDQTASSLLGGGAIYVTGDLTMDDSTLFQNTANRAAGGAIRALGNVSIEDSFFDGNQTTTAQDGGALHVTGSGDVVVTESIFEDNISAQRGGALYVAADSLQLFDTEIYFNVAAGDGGGLYLVAGAGQNFLPVLKRSLVYDNEADQGGGVYVQYGASAATMVMENSTFSTNYGRTSGGAFEVAGFTGTPAIAVTVRLESCTVWNNTSGSATTAAEEVGPGVFEYRDSLIDGNCGVGGNGTTLGGNVIAATGATQCIDNFFTDITDTPIFPLDALGNGSGGITRYHATSGYSMGHNWLTCSVSEDQRAVSRPVGGTCDSGAFER